MRYRILHDILGRLRLRLLVPPGLTVPERCWDPLSARVFPAPRVRFNHRSKTLLVEYSRHCRRNGGPEPGDGSGAGVAVAATDRNGLRTEILILVEQLQPAELEPWSPSPLERHQADLVGRGLLMLCRPLLPPPLRLILLVKTVTPYLLAAVRRLSRGEIDTEVLDGAAISAALALGEDGTATTIAFLLDLGSYLEEWTRDRSRRHIAGLYSLRRQPARRLRGRREEVVAVEEIGIGELVVIREGDVCPVDGRVEQGRGKINQAPLTGESLPIGKKPGNLVYAGTLVCQGELVVRVEQEAGECRIARIVRLLEESSHRKAAIQNRAEELARRVVPWSFLLSGLTLAVTGNLARAAAALLVDYSCAIKLATPLTVINGMVRSAKAGAVIKGGKFLEILADADTLVLDKTGTLTKGRAEVERVLVFNGCDHDQVLRDAACLEEHYFHPIAGAVIREAAQRGLEHEEHHTEVHHFLAHGVRSTIDGREILVGSRHFLEEDNGVELREVERILRGYARQGKTLLYMAYDRVLAAVFVIADPPRPDAAAFLHRADRLGLRRRVMLTGDHRETAAALAEQLGISEWVAEIFPEDKTAYIEKLQAEGSRVVMIGDGINDAPALARADLGVSFHHAADLAQEAADLVLMGDDLNSLLTARHLARGALSRVRQNYRIIVGVNSSLILLGLAGLISPAASALLHNGATILVAANSLRR